MFSHSVLASIIGPKGLLRDGLVSLLRASSYSVRGSHETAAEIGHASEVEQPGIVLLVARTVRTALAEARLARRICPDCKIVALLEGIPDDCFSMLARSDMDGCVPLHVSQEVLIRTLDLVISDNAQIMVLTDDRTPSSLPVNREPENPQSQMANGGRTGNSRQIGDPSREFVDEAPAMASTPNFFDSEKSAAGAGSESRMRSRPIFASSKPEQNGPLHPREDGDPHQLAFVGQTLVDAAVPALSGRQRQIVEGLVKGQSNKIIARACGITEATVKVHMKAILRKVACSNRTQVAIWAIENASVLPQSGRPAATIGRNLPETLGSSEDAASL